MEPELDPVDLEDRSILSSSEQEPVSSEGVVVAISDAISELRSLRSRSRRAFSRSGME